MTKFLCGLIFLTACGAAQTVDGTIVDSVTGTGIAAARVFLRPVSAETDYSATTDELGHFLFQDVKAGAYRFVYVSRDYLPTDLRQVQVTEDGKTLTLEGRMTPQPRISGRVVDSNRDGVPNARVEVIPQGSLSTTTDATGKFELLPGQPGAYILSVVPPMGLKPPDPEADSGRVMVWTRAFYPGVALLESASRGAVPRGGEVSGIEMKLLAVPAHAVRGVLVSSDGTPAPKVTITMSEGPQPRRLQQAAARVESNADGAFEFPRVVDGEWRLAAEVESGGEKLRAMQWIDMTGRDLEDVKLRFASPFTVRGQVAMETPKGTKGPDPFPVLLVPHGRDIRSDTGQLNWMLWPVLQFEVPIPRNVPDAAAVREATEEITSNELGESGAIRATPRVDGTFSLENVYPGSYRIISMPPPPWYMAAIRVGQAELTTAEVELGSGAVPITVVYRTDGGSVGGTAEKCASGVVLLIPRNPALQSFGFLRSARCDSGDRYEFTAVRPGDYYALAFAGDGGLPQMDDVPLAGVYS